MVNDPRFAELVEAVGEIENDATLQQVRDDLEVQWSECMAEAGFPDLEAPWAAEEQIMAELGALEPDPELLAALRAREIDMATTDLQCRSTTEWDQRLLQAQFAAEEKFITDYRTDIDALELAIADAQAQ